MHPCLEPETVVENKGHHARTIGIQISPNPAAKAFQPVGLAFEERGIGEQRRRDGLKGDGHPHFLHHVRFGPEVEVHLNRAGAPHHHPAHRADLLHIGVHQLVPPLGHQRHFVMRPDGRGPKADEPDANLVRDILDLAQVVVHLVTGLVNGFQRRARQFQRPARFKADVCAILCQADQMPAFLDRGPAVAVAQPFQNGADGPRAVIGNGFQRVFAIAELFVFGTDAPIFFRLAPLGQEFCQLINVFNGASAGLWDGHGATASGI